MRNNRATTSGGAARLVAAGAAITMAAGLAGAPARAEGDNHVGALSSSERTSAEKLALERAARVRDLLRFMALGARRAAALSFGRVEATPDGSRVRIHNTVVVLRRLPFVYSIRLIEIRDFDRAHLLPHRMTFTAFGTEAELGTIPRFLRGMMLALGVKHMRSNVWVDYRYDERSKQFSLSRMNFQWADYGALNLSAELENVPSPKTLLAEGMRIGAAARTRLKSVRLKTWRVDVVNQTAHEVLFKSGAFIRRVDADEFKKRTLEQLARTAAAAQTSFEKSFWTAARTVISGPSKATLTATARRSVLLDHITDIRSAQQFEKVFSVRVDASEASPDEIAKSMVEPAPAPWLKGARSVTDPPVHECDTAAAEPADEKRKAAGVVTGLIDGAVALAACKRATMEYPAAARFRFQYGRALLKADHRQLSRSTLRLASDANYAAATLYLGRTYVDPDGGARNPELALRLFRKAEEQGSKEARLEIARAFLFGTGIEKDPEEALKRIRDSGVQDRPLAKALLGEALWYGWSVERDQARAFELFKDAAERGNAQAQASLAKAYVIGGSGVKPNPERAYFWYTVLRNSGRKSVVAPRAELAKKLHIDVRRRITRQARLWQPRAR